MGVFLQSSIEVIDKRSIIYKVFVFLSVSSLLLFPVSSTLLSLVSGGVIGLIVVASIMFFLLPLRGGQNLDREERLFYFSVSFMVIVAVLVTTIAGIDHLGIKKLGKFFYLLMVVPVYVFFRTVRVRSEWVWYGLVIGAFASSLIGFYEITNDIYRPGYPGRAKGATHPIIFGDLALLMGCMALTGWGYFRERGKWYVLLPLVGAFSGVVASILSQSRGGWVAVPFISLILFWYAYGKVSKLKLFGGVMVLIASVIAVYVMPQTKLKEKVHTTIERIKIYSESKVHNHIRSTSVGSRLESWRASWFVFQENPIIGVGWGNYQETAQELVQRGVVHKSVGTLDHPHNQFLSAMASGGIIALIAIAFLFYVPARVFYYACKSTDRSKNSRRLALSGMILVVGFVVFNLTESFLERSRTVGFFIFYLAVCMAGIREKKT